VTAANAIEFLKENGKGTTSVVPQNVRKIPRFSGGGSRFPDDEK
jgi:hypothetical protein